MAALARLQSSSAANPVLDIFTSVNGVLSDVFLVEFQIYDKTSGTPVQIYPATAGARVTIDPALTPVGQKLSNGRYFAPYTVEAAANIGTHSVKWYFKLTSSTPEQTFYEDFEVLTEAMAAGVSPEESYIFVADMRDEGVPASITDAWLAKRILLASRFVDAATKRFFSAREMTIRVDGRGGSKILLSDPIIAISEVLFDTTPWAPSATEIDLDLVRVYNRHLSQGLLSPDDRNNPKLELFSPSEMLTRYGSSRSWARLVFPRGQQNVTITGVFGYTDPGGPNARGKTPELIKHVTKLLVMRELDKMSRVANRWDRHNRHRLTSERTRDQAYTLDPLGPARGFFTGEPEIDNILAFFLRPPTLGAA